MGIQLNFEKRELPATKTRHLGFIIDLVRKVVLITDKHTRKILSFFDYFRAAIRRKQGIPIINLQKMLGLQIWISTAFRVAHQFLTSVCDIIRVTGKSHFFRPARFPGLVVRATKDLSFYRRFVTKGSTMTFDYLLCRLPSNINRLSIDASASFGIAGVLRFAGPRGDYPGYEGLFWQSS